MSAPRLTLLAPLLASLAVPGAARADEPPAPPATVAAAAEAPPAPPLAAPRLTVDLGTAAAVTGTELALTGLSLAFKDRLAAPACRWCEPPQLDRWARGRLRWHDPALASNASDVLQLLVPAGAMVTLWVQAAPQGRREVIEDLAVVTETATTVVLLTQGVKYAAGRLRPDAWARGGAASADDKLSFWSGHTDFAFAVAASATQVARLRGRPGWKWLAAATFGAAALTGYLRVAGDRHWLTDVAAGAGVGTAAGLVIPLLVLRPADGREPAVTLVPAPGGLAVLF